MEDLETRCRESGIEIVTRQSFLNDPSESVRNLRRQVLKVDSRKKNRNLSTIYHCDLQDARIIVGLFYVVAARRVLCEMYKQGLYGSSYVWFFIGWYEDNWYEANLSQEKIECTREQMKEAAEGHLTTEALNWNQDNQRTISGMVRNILTHTIKQDFSSFHYTKLFCYQDCRGLSQAVEHGIAEQWPRCYCPFPRWIPRSSSRLRRGLGSCPGYEQINLHLHTTHIVHSSLQFPFRFSFCFLFRWRSIFYYVLGSLFGGLLHQYLRKSLHESFSG